MKVFNENNDEFQINRCCFFEFMLKKPQEQTIENTITLFLFKIPTFTTFQIKRTGVPNKFSFVTMLNMKLD